MLQQKVCLMYNKIEMSENKKTCPQFPYWGASYPDACCINGKLYDLDRCDETAICTNQ